MQVKKKGKKWTSPRESLRVGKKEWGKAVSKGSGEWGKKTEAKGLETVNIVQNPGGIWVKGEIGELAINCCLWPQLGKMHPRGKSRRSSTSKKKGT